MIKLNENAISEKTMILIADALQHDQALCSSLHHANQTQQLIELLRDPTQQKINLKVLSLNNRI
jgi:uncharacterized membrane protein YjjP (DUF1212 family)